MWVGCCFSDGGCPDPKMLISKLRTKSFLLLIFFLKWYSTFVEGVNDKEGCLFFFLLEKGQALLTWLSGESQWQEASRAINPEGWGSVENGQPSQFSARLPFAFSFLFTPFVCMLVTVILFCSSHFPSRWCCSSLKPFLHPSHSRSLVSHVDDSDRLKLKLRPQRLTALFLEIVWNCRIKRRSRRQHLETHTRTCTIWWGITKATERNGSFIMIAAGISGHNYQRWLIHSLIASFNLFTFGAEQCQPAADESNLLQGRGTCMSHRLLHVSIFVMVVTSGHLAKPRSLIMQFNNWKMGGWFCCFRGKWLRNRWESKLEGVKRPLHNRPLY